MKIQVRPRIHNGRMAHTLRSATVREGRNGHGSVSWRDCFDLPQTHCLVCKLHKDICVCPEHPTAALAASEGILAANQERKIRAMWRRERRRRLLREWGGPIAFGVLLGLLILSAVFIDRIATWVGL